MQKNIPSLMGFASHIYFFFFAGWGGMRTSVISFRDRIGRDFSKSRDPGISLIFSSIFLEIGRDFSGLTFFYGIFN